MNQASTLPSVLVQTGTMTAHRDLNEAEEFLLQFHQVYPGCTPRTFAQSRTASGDSVYDLLVKATPLGARVLDLGCGDGYLLEQLVRAGHSPEQLNGVDLSPAELALATERRSLQGVTLHPGHAAALPLAPDSVDVVVSNLVLMLVAPLEAVADEIARVLVSKGKLHAIIGGGPRMVGGPDAADAFLEELSILARTSDTSMPRLGDRRTRSLEGLAQVFSPAQGFTELDLVDHYVSQTAPFEVIWDSLTPVYERVFLDTAAMARLKTRFKDRCRAYAQSDGRIPCSWAVRHFSATRC